MASVNRETEKMIDHPKMSIKTCPYCHGSSRHPTGRADYWKLLPFTRAYACTACRSEYIVLFGVVSRLVHPGFKIDAAVSAW